MEQILNELKSRYNYSDELLNFLGKLIPIMIRYFGEEYREKIVSCFIETQIIVSQQQLNDELGLENRTDLLTAGGGYCHDVIIENGQPVKKSIVIVPSGPSAPFSFDNQNKVGDLVHELCHMVKSGIIVNQETGEIIEYCGLSQYYGIIKDGEYIEMSNNRGTGLEEALNAIDELYIMNKMYDDYKLSNNYVRLAGNIIQMIRENDIFLSMIRKSQFTGTRDWESYLGVEISEELLQLCSEQNDIMGNRIFELIRSKQLQQRLEDVEGRIREIVFLSKVQELTEKAKNECQGETEKEVTIRQIMLFDKYVKENIDYGFAAMNFQVEHPNEKNPYSQAFELQGFYQKDTETGKRLATCGSISKAAQIFLKNLGCKCDYVWGHFNIGTDDNPKYVGHRWNVISIGDKNYMVDFTISMIIHNLMKDSNYTKCAFELFGVTDERKEFDYLFFDKLAPNESIGGFRKDEKGRTIDDLNEFGKLNNTTSNPYDIFPNLSFISPQDMSQYLVPTNKQY